MPRQAHVYRVYQTDDNGVITDSDVWIDVMRIDRCIFQEPRGSPDGESHIDRQYVILWGDDTVNIGTGKNAPTRRTYELLDVVQAPEQGGDPNDPSLPDVAIPLIRSTWIRYRGLEQGFATQEVQWVFRNFIERDSSQKTGRQSTQLRITNNDLNNEINFPEVNDGDPQPPTDPSANPLVDWNDYAQALQDGLIDDTQFIDVELTDRFEIRFPPSPIDHAGEAVALFGQQITYVLVNRQRAGIGPIGVEDLFDSPPGDGGGADSGTPENTPGGFWRTDPFQAIVNVSWGGLAVEFGDKDGAPPSR